MNRTTLDGAVSERKERFIHAYNTTSVALDFALNYPGELKNLKSLIAYLDCTLPGKNFVTNNSVNKPLELIAMNLAWHVQILKHPIKMVRLAYSYIRA